MGLTLRTSFLLIEEILLDNAVDQILLGFDILLIILGGFLKSLMQACNNHRHSRLEKLLRKL